MAEELSSAHPDSDSIVGLKPAPLCIIIIYMYNDHIHELKYKRFHTIPRVLNANTCRVKYNVLIQERNCITVSRVSRMKRSSDCAVNGSWNKS